MSDDGFLPINLACRNGRHADCDGVSTFEPRREGNPAPECPCRCHYGDRYAQIAERARTRNAKTAHYPDTPVASQEQAEISAALAARQADAIAGSRS